MRSVFRRDQLGNRVRVETNSASNHNRTATQSEARGVLVVAIIVARSATGTTYANAMGASPEEIVRVVSVDSLIGHRAGRESGIAIRSQHVPNCALATEMRFVYRPISNGDMFNHRLVM